MNVLILGCGNAQVDAIKYLKDRGHIVHALSYRNEGPGRYAVDHFNVVDIVDRTQVLIYALNNEIELVYSIGSDLAMPTIAWVSELLNLPYFVDSATAMTMHNKGAFRAFLSKHRINTMAYAVCESIEDLKDWSQFPAIVKPLDSQGQRGVMVASNTQELETAFRYSLPYSRSKSVIVETYIEGPEISVNAYIYENAVKHAFVSDRNIIKGDPGGIPEYHSVPSRIPKDKLSRVYLLVEQIIQALGIRSGPVYFQMKVDRDKIYVIEATPRLDGCHLWRLIHLAYGVDLLDLAFRHLLCSQAVQFEEPGTLSEKRSLIYSLAKPGTVFTEESLGGEDKEFAAFYYNEGEEVLAVNGRMERTGYHIIKGAGE